MTVDPYVIGSMGVCDTCRDVVGPIDPRSSALDRRMARLQEGTCPLHKLEPTQERWPGSDFNRHVDLCRCCGTVALRSGSRWAVWFCAACKEQVGLLNGRHGRCVVPIGRHSVQWGYMLTGEQADNPVNVHLFVEGLRSVFESMRVLSDWGAEAIGRNLEALGAGRGSVILLDEYCREAQERIDPMQRFRQMCEYLAERGRRGSGDAVTPPC